MGRRYDRTRSDKKTEPDIIDRQKKGKTEMKRRRRGDTNGERQRPTVQI